MSAPAVAILYGLLAAPLSAEPLTLDWASFPVEREHFSEDGGTGRYAEDGVFAGVGMMYVSQSRKTIRFEGLSRIDVPHLGQAPGHRYEFRFETFRIQSFFSTGPGEFTFEAVREGTFPRRLTGKLRLSASGALPAADIDAFVADEHGEAIRGVMNRFSLASSPPAEAMLEKYDEVFFGGYVALEPEGPQRCSSARRK